jgi:hypothetical protein
MTPRLLSGHLWHAITPSYYQLDSHPVELAFDGRHWYLAMFGRYDRARPWPSRDAAAAAIAAAFLEHQQQERGLV